MLQHGNNDRDNGCRQTCGAGKAHVNNDEEQGHDRQDHQGSRIFEPKADNDLVSHPGGCFGREQSRAQRDADAEQEHCAPVDLMHDVVPVHDADLGQHQQSDCDHCRRGGVDGMQFLFGGPEDQQENGDD